MEQTITYTKTYREYKQELGTELSKTAEGFVRIGFLLKVARDTEILAESGYTTVTEFAKAEFDIDKTMVSRFISINDKFAEGGYSDQLQEQYKGYGYAKLTLMLTLPDEINAQLSPAYSKAEIQAIKDEVDEEKNISDLEVMMEQPAASTAPGTDGGENTLLDRLIRQLGEDSPELYVQMAPAMSLQGKDQIRNLKETMAPNGEKQYSIRISGIGRYMVSIRDTEDTITATSLRTMEQHTYDYPALLAAWAAILPPSNESDTEWTEEQIRISWELEYGREYPVKAEVAPVQPKKPGKTELKPTSRKESKVQKAPKSSSPRTTPEPEKPEGTGTEAAGEPTRQPEEDRPAPQEAETPGNTGTEAEFYPGMRVRNAGGAVGHPDATIIGTIIGPGVVPNTWEVQYDGYEVSLLICASEAKEFVKVDWEDPRTETAITAEEKEASWPEEQLPGQIGMEEAIGEAEKRAVSYIEPNISQTAESRTAGQLDADWFEKKFDFVNEFDPIRYTKLTVIESKTLRIVREHAISIVALIEEEILRRGERY